LITKKDILDLEIRRHVYNIILKYPGLHFRELSRKVNLSAGGLRHHLKYLEKQEFVTKRIYKRYTCYYISNKVGNNEKELLHILRQDVPRKIVLLLLTAGPAELYKKSYNQKKPTIRRLIHSKKDLINLTKYWNEPFDTLFFLNKKRQTIDFHLNKLINAGIVEKIRVGREMKYQIKDEFRVWLFFANYKDAFSDELVNFKLEWHNDFIEKRTDAIFDVIWDVFPHPYYV